MASLSGPHPCRMSISVGPFPPFWDSDASWTFSYLRRMLSSRAQGVSKDPDSQVHRCETGQCRRLLDWGTHDTSGGHTHHSILDCRRPVDASISCTRPLTWFVQNGSSRERFYYRREHILPRPWYSDMCSKNIFHPPAHPFQMVGGYLAWRDMTPLRRSAPCRAPLHRQGELRDRLFLNTREY